MANLSQRHTLEDEELMKAYAQGDQSAFAELYQRYEQRLFAFLERRLPVGRKHSASDLFQKTWLKVHVARKTFDPKQGVPGWLFTIAVNLLRDHVSKASFRLEIEQEEALSHMPSQDDLEKNLLIKEELGRAENLLTHLTLPQREILMMSEWDGLSAREIGQVYELSEPAVRQTLFRAKRRIKALLKTQENTK